MESEVERQILLSRDEFLTLSTDTLNTQHQQLGSHVSAAGLLLLHCVHSILFQTELKCSDTFSALTLFFG